MNKGSEEETIEQIQESVFKIVFTKSFIAVSLINFLLMTGYYAIFVVCTQFAQSSYGISTAFAGLITGIVVIGCMIGRFFSGSIVNKGGYYRILTVGLILYFISNLLYFCSVNEYVLFIVRMLAGVSMGIVGTVTGTIVAVITPKKYHGRAIAYYSLSTALALCFGPFIGISLVSTIGYKGIFLLTSILSGFCFFCLMFVKVKSEAKKEAAHKMTLNDFIDMKLVPFASVCALFCIAWGNIQAFIGPYGEIEGVQSATAFFFLFYAGAVMISRPFTGKVFDVTGPDRIFYSAILALALGCCLLWLNLGSIAVLLAGVLCGYGFGNITSVGNAVAISMVPRERFAQATSTFYIFFDIGIGIAPFISGYLVPSLGYSGVYGATALLTLAGLPLYWMVMRNRPNPQLGVRMKFKDKQ